MSRHTNSIKYDLNFGDYNIHCIRKNISFNL